MALRAAAVMVCACVFAYASAVPSGAKDPVAKDFEDHRSRVRGFVCLDPRPTAISLTELGLTNVNGKIYSPPMTVLHRCYAGAGCCSTRGEVCRPHTDQTIDLTFQVEYVNNSMKTFEKHSVVNHTRCHCVPEEASNPR